MKWQWVKYHILVFIILGIYNYINNFYVIIPEGKIASYTLFFIIHNLVFVGYFYLNLFLVSPFIYRKIYFLIPWPAFGPASGPSS